jgi:hypothetical protein
LPVLRVEPSLEGVVDRGFNLDFVLVCRHWYNSIVRTKIPTAAVT